ncbi:MAG: ADP-ribosylglycohydrolase family protein [Thermaerobacter sp.]|nr:ADP-ribosylglycohydrolase family protein [Thermaerobacter sp.]
MDLRSRYRGAIYGLAVGDAMGASIEFGIYPDYHPIFDLRGGGPHNLEAGQWTDDTSMALCLADSLLHLGEFDAQDQLRRYLRWLREGYRSSTGKCFDAGGTVRTALQRFERRPAPYCGSEDPNSAGNGSIMRLCPVPLFFRSDPRVAIARSADSSRTTHAARTTIDACRYLGGLIVGALEGRTKRELLSPRFTPIAGLFDAEPLCPEIERIALGAFKNRRPPSEIKGSGYVVDSLEAALWAFYHGETFLGGLYLAVNLGNDADTTGAVFGQLAGAHFGTEEIPADFRRSVAQWADLEAVADGLYEASQSLAR